MTCNYNSSWGRCQQKPRGLYGFCTYHLRALRDGGFPHDTYYHRKIVLGLLQPTDDYLSSTELDQMFGGRNRHDGRRLDNYAKL